MPRDILQFINELIVQFCKSPVSSPITWCLGIIWIIKSIYALYKMKAKTDELAAEREAKEISEAVKNLDVLAEKSKEENQDIRALMFENLKELKEFYVICKQQIRKSFSAAMFSCFAGFVLFVLAVIIFLLGGNNSASLTAGLSGAIVEIVSGLYFWMYRETSKQLGKYHKRLEATEKYLIALQIIEMLPEENRNEQYGKLIDYIFENVNKKYERVRPR